MGNEQRSPERGTFRDYYGMSYGRKRNIMHPTITNKEDFFSAVIGMVLGDGWVCRITKRNPNARISLGHSIKQEEYLDFKLGILSYLTRTHKYYKNAGAGKTNKRYKAVVGQSMCHPLYSKIRRLCYPDEGTKVVNREMLDKLTPLSLALWYMDDGSTKVDRRHKRCRATAELATCGFSYDEHLVIQEYFLERWGIKTSIQGRGKYFRIYFNHKNSLKLMDIIRPYIHSSMSYKIVHTIDSGTPPVLEDDIVRPPVKAGELVRNV